jgi:hypothetical protein
VMLGSSSTTSTFVAPAGVSIILTLRSRVIPWLPRAV